MWIAYVLLALMVAAICVPFIEDWLTRRRPDEPKSPAAVMPAPPDGREDVI